MSDNPLENATLNQLGSVEDPAPYVYVTKTGREKVTFPDPGKMEWTEAEAFLMRLATRPDTQVVAEWLSDGDHETFLKEKLTLRQYRLVINDVQRHYEDIFGTQGEEPASDA